ncbi:MAG: hypothetical protein R6U65_03500 [Perlabentimonas sp.]
MQSIITKTKFITKARLIVLFLAASAILSGCQALKGLRSEGQPHLQEASDLWDEGKELESLIPATEALIVDPEFFQGKGFINDRFDITINKANERLIQIGEPQTSEQAEEVYYIYDNFVKIYDNVAKMKLPVEHHRGRWTWTTKVKDYTQQKEESRLLAFDLLMKEAREHVASHEISNAEGKFLNAINNYVIDNEKKDSLKLAVATELTDFADKFKDSEIIEEAELSYKTYQSAIKFVPTFEAALEGIKNTALHISNLYNNKGVALEDKGDIDNLIASINEFDNALKWNNDNQKAKDNKERVIIKIAEHYYQEGLKAENSDDKGEAAKQFELVRKWIPDYKDSMQRLYTNRIGDKIEEMAKNLSTTRGEHNKLQAKMNGVSKNVDKSVDVMNKVTYISGQTQSLNSSMKKTESTLRVFSSIPKVGIVTTTLARSVNMAQKPVGAASDKFTKVEKPVITPTKNLVVKTQGIVNKTKSTMGKTESVLQTTENYTLHFKDCAATVTEENNFKEAEKAIDEINKSLKTTNNALGNINKGLDVVNKNVKPIAGLSGTVNKVEKGLKDVDKVMSKVDPIVNNLNKVLDKSFTLNLGFKKFTFSVKKILTGLPKEVKMIMGKFEDLAMKALDPVLKKFKIEVPSIPGLDHLSKEIDNMKGYYNNINNEYNNVSKSANEYSNSQKHIETNLRKLENAMGCELGK